MFYERTGIIDFTDGTAYGYSCLYGQWLINRIRQGFVDVRNPYNPMQITRYPINHEVVDGIAFCTKNPLPFIPLLHEINDYRQYWHMTITPYGADIDTNVPQVD